MKLCKDCAFFAPEGEECNSSSSIRVYDLLYGNHGKIGAKAMREDENQCGFSGKLFVEKMKMNSRTNFVEGGYIL
jgi:hypothetical protein